MTVSQAVLLAGGLGTRLGPVAQGLPKAMVPVGGRPFLEYLVRQLALQAFEEILLLVGHRADAIQSHFGDGRGWGIRIRTSREFEPLGTGGALVHAQDFLAPRFLLLYADLYRDYNYAAFCAAHSGNALAVYPYTSGLATISCANVGLDAATGRVAAYVKGDPSMNLTHVDAGFGVYAREVLDLLPERTSSFESIVFPALARSGSLSAHAVDREFFDIGNLVDLERARAVLPGRIRS